PMMCARLLRAEPPGKRHGSLFRLSERFYDEMSAGYMRGVDWVLEHRFATLAFTGLTLAATLWLYVIVPKGFLPVQDTGLLLGITDAAQDISFTSMAERQRAIADIVRRDPDVVAVDSFVGVSTVNPAPNSGRLYIDIGSPDRGRAGAVEIMQRLRTAAAAVPGITLHLQPVQDVTIETRSSRTQFQYVLQDIDESNLSRNTERLVTALRGRR